VDKRQFYTPGMRVQFPGCWQVNCQHAKP
jgi:hypothetical protein